MSPQPAAGDALHLKPERSRTSVRRGASPAGRHLDPVDRLIAAIVHSHGLAVATRNLSDFECMEVELVDPWASP